MNRNILIGGAWPYANGSLHIGHIAGLLPGDVLARYHRVCGDKVYFVSGFIRDFHEKLYKSEYVYEKETPVAFCEYCRPC